MSERSKVIDWVRSEVIGPARPLNEPYVIRFQNGKFVDPMPLRSGPLAWRSLPDGNLEEVLYYQRETPHRKYGAGVLHPEGSEPLASTDEVAATTTDTLGIDLDPSDSDILTAEDESVLQGIEDSDDAPDALDDFEVTSPDIRRPSTLGISFCVRLDTSGSMVVGLPNSRRLSWQDESDKPIQMNGRYEPCVRQWTDEHGTIKEAPMWRRLSAISPSTSIQLSAADLAPGQVVRREVEMPSGSPLRLRVEVFPRSVNTHEGVWLLTVVLRNCSQVNIPSPHVATLYQAYFDVSVTNGRFEKYPENQQPFDRLDQEEQSLSLLYRESAVWGIGHGCAAGWDTNFEAVPQFLFADVMPSVQVPSMTPDIKDINGSPIKLSMRTLAALNDDRTGSGWMALADLANEYRRWIDLRRDDREGLSDLLKPVADRHIDAAESCLRRINAGIEALQTDDRILKAFRLANLAILLQQIGTKQLKRRPLRWSQSFGGIRPEGIYSSPWLIYQEQREESNLGVWRAFQIAFLLMSIPGISTEDLNADREVVDLIWFPTGGGKTEAYLGVMAFYMFYQRFLMEVAEPPLRDGTNVLMRYTLRMLTTQQFQRAASLICAMEFLRRNPGLHEIGMLPGRRFSLGLWIGGSGSPNNIANARDELSAFRNNRYAGNPLVLTECPWCRAEIGKYEGTMPKALKGSGRQRNAPPICGVSNHATEGPLLLCPDPDCTYGSEQWRDWLPVEVIDERIYNNPPSLVIGTADKFAMIAFRPEAGAIFGRSFESRQPFQRYVPPGLIVQDELHLISGPLGTIYGLYEAIFERLCSRRVAGGWLKPKIIASTATIRGASEQVRALYARNHIQLFPSPGLVMGDSFFGTYSREPDRTLSPGRLYLGIHASDYGSILTTQVRVFSSVLFRPYSFDSKMRDAWWSLLVFYNSIRELGGAKTLFDSDIRSRLKFVFNRENCSSDDRRNLRIVEELTSRLSQAEIVGMIDKLSTVYSDQNNQAIDVCLASSIIEVGVDIDRLSVMGVVGQPKTTAQYIQVTGRVGRRWWERPGLILTIYNPGKSRDRSHFEQFHSYHRRLYERVEPTSATPFSLSAIQRALPGALIAWSRQQINADVRSYGLHEQHLDNGLDLLMERCRQVQASGLQERSLDELDKVFRDLRTKWEKNPQEWEHFPPIVNGEYLMLWPGQFATLSQKQNGVTVPSSMRQVDGSAELTITQSYDTSDASKAT